jgi:hypothetical protein
MYFQELTARLKPCPFKSEDENGRFSAICEAMSDTNHPQIIHFSAACSGTKGRAASPAFVYELHLVAKSARALAVYGVQSANLIHTDLIKLSRIGIVGHETGRVHATAHPP